MTAYCRCSHSQKRHTPKCLTCPCKSFTPKRADGGPITKAVEYTVGERGPELVIPDAGIGRSLSQQQRDAILARVNTHVKR